jgi:hypothetical protein
MQLLIMQRSLTTCHFIPLRSKYSPKHPVFKYPQSVFFPTREGQQLYSYEIKNSCATFCFRLYIEQVITKFNPHRNKPVTKPVREAKARLWAVAPLMIMMNKFIAFIFRAKNLNNYAIQLYTSILFSLFKSCTFDKTAKWTEKHLHVRSTGVLNVVGVTLRKSLVQIKSCFILFYIIVLVIKIVGLHQKNFR